MDPNQPQNMPPQQPMMMQPMMMPPQPMVMQQQPMMMPQQPMMVQPMMAQPPPQVDLLQGLTTLPTMLVKQRPKGWCLEVCCNFEVENEYKIYNPLLNNPSHIMIAKEKSGCCARCWCGPQRPFEMTIETIDQREVLRFERPYHLRHGGMCCFCCDFGWQVVNVFGGANTQDAGQYLGKVMEKWSFFVPVFGIYDKNGTEVYRIVGDCCGCGNYTLKIFDPRVDIDETNELGVITKMWSGTFKELFTDYDNFFINFPVAANAHERGILMAALFLIDFMFFERDKRNNNGISVTL